MAFLRAACAERAFYDISRRYGRVRNARSFAFFFSDYCARRRVIELAALNLYGEDNLVGIEEVIRYAKN